MLHRKQWSNEWRPMLHVFLYGMFGTIGYRKPQMATFYSIGRVSFVSSVFSIFNIENIQRKKATKIRLLICIIHFDRRNKSIWHTIRYYINFYVKNYNQKNEYIFIFTNIYIVWFFWIIYHRKWIVCANKQEKNPSFIHRHTNIHTDEHMKNCRTKTNREKCDTRHNNSGSKPTGIYYYIYTPVLCWFISIQSE